MTWKVATLSARERQHGGGEGGDEGLVDVHHVEPLEVQDLARPAGEEGGEGEAGDGLVGGTAKIVLPRR